MAPGSVTVNMTVMISQMSRSAVSRQHKYKVRIQLDINHYSAGIDFSCQNLMSVDVRFWRLNISNCP